jgi:hypothetical protein
MQGGVAEKLPVLPLGMFGQTQPELRHREPMRLRFQRLRFMRQRETTLRPVSELFGQIRQTHHPLLHWVEDLARAMVPARKARSALSAPEESKAAAEKSV